MLEPTRAPRPPHMEPPPPRRGGGFVRFVSGLLTVLLVIMVGIGALGLLLYHQFETPGPLEVSRVVVIPKGEGRIQIASRLERDGVISNRWTFIASYLMQNLLADEPEELKAGEYEIKKQASMADVLAVLTQGKSILSKLTIPEGLTSQQIVERIREEPDLIGEITEIPSEGTLLPDTYRFSKGMSRQELLDRMQAEMRRFLVGAWQRRQTDLPLNSPEEAIVFASIVEKETGRADERDRVASVFVNRLRNGMRLQSDPTVIYGIVGGEGRLGRPLTRADLNKETQHNTYKVKGLPPTPICNPGRAAIQATLNPAKTKDLYFVADGTGGHAFSETLRDHNSAVSNWRKIERRMRKQRDEEEAATAATLSTAISAGGASEASSASDSANAAGVPLPIRKPSN